MGQSNSGHTENCEPNDYVSITNYTGEVRNGMRYGKGMFMYSNGDIYDGEWKKDRRYGYGIYTFADGTITEGYFYKDTFMGKEPKGKLAKKLKHKRKTHGGKHGSEPLRHSYSNKERVVSHEEEDGVFDRPQGLKERNLEPAEREELRRRQEEITLKREESKRLTEAMRQKYQLPDRKLKDGKEIRESIRTKYSLSKKSASSTSSYKESEKDRQAEQLQREENKKLRESLRAKYNLNKR